MTNREIEDFIAPGEFQFCHRCGLYLTMESGLCAKCERGAESAGAGEDVHRVLLGKRAYIAKLRRDSGVKPLFWT